MFIALAGNLFRPASCSYTDMRRCHSVCRATIIRCQFQLVLGDKGRVRVRELYSFVTPIAVIYAIEFFDLSMSFLDERCVIERYVFGYIEAVLATCVLFIFSSVHKAQLMRH